MTDLLLGGLSTDKPGEWFKVGAKVLSLLNSWVIVQIDADSFLAVIEGVDEWTRKPFEPIRFQTHELFWFTPVPDRFNREISIEGK